MKAQPVVSAGTQRKAPRPNAPARVPADVSAGQTCLRCGSLNRAESRFCMACGAGLDAQAPIPRTRWAGAHVSSIGKVRENNEDRLALHLPPQNPHLAVALVADGMGGENAGEIASQMAAEVIDRSLTAMGLGARVPAGMILPDALGKALVEANTAVFNAAREDLSRSNMGSTAVLAVAQDALLHLAHVGDSRAYLVTRDGKVFLLTRDHTLVASLLAAGQLTKEEADQHPERGVLYRCLGQAEKVQPDLQTRRLEPGDRLLLCTDGLTRHVTDAEIGQAVVAGPSPRQTCERLIAQANTRGGEDNISVICLWSAAGS